MENMDKSTFSLDDEEYDEEEIIERDEEYEDDDYDDYDEEYDDEDYGDEDYDDEEYDDYDDDGYDDGYNDDYYDDRLNKVLDEIAEIKRNMAPSTAVQMPIQPMPPQYVYQPSAPPAGSEVVMYNEISRLRDELARNQSNLEMQKELTRLKEDMARDQRFAESQYTAEIKRLQDKVEELQKNALSPQNELPAGQEVARLEGGNETSSQSVDFNKLLSINEAILVATRESDARLQTEIANIKKELESFPSTEDLHKAITSIKKASAHVSSGGLSDDAINGIAAEIAALKNALGGVGASSGAVIQAESSDIDASELLRQLYEIKALIGSTSEATLKRTQTVLDLIADFKKVDFDVHSPDVSYKDKLSSLYAFTKKLSECGESDAVDLIEATNALIGVINGKNLDKKSFADVAAYFQEKGTPISSSVKESADRFFDLAAKVAAAEITEVSDYLPDLVAERNKMEENRRKDANEAALNSLTKALLNEQRDAAAIRGFISALTDVSVGDLVELQYIPSPKSYKTSRTVSSDTIFSKIADIKTAIENIQLIQGEAPVEEPQEQVQEEVQEEVTEPAAPPATQADLDSLANEVLASVDDLKAMLEAQKREPSTVVVSENSESDISAVFEDVRNQYIDISDKLIAISERLAEPPPEDAPIMTPEEKEKALGDLEYIHTKLDDYEVFLNQIGEIRNDILGISSGGGDFTEQFNSLVTEITTQFDKLYEDVSNALIDSETNIVNRLTESGDVSVAVEAAKADIINDTQAILIETQGIRDALSTINDSLLASPINDAIEQLRADLSSFADINAANVEVASADREKLLEDVAFLREQAEMALNSGEQPVSESAGGDAVIAYIDDISARISALPTVDDINAINEKLTAVGDNVSVVSEGVVSVNDGLASVSDGVIAVNDNVNAVNENVVALGDSLAAISGDVAETLATVKPIADQINAILDKIDAAAIDSDTTNPEDSPISAKLEEIRDNVSTILDTLSLFPQRDDVITTRDNTYSILDTLTTLPQNDEIVSIRDNVAAMLDSINSLSEKLNTVTDALNPADTAAILDNTNAILASVPATLADDVVALRDTTNAMLDSLTLAQDDLGYIRQKLDDAPEGEQVDSVAAVMQDINAVLDKLDTYEQTALNNKQEIVDSINSIKEEIHIKELDGKISAEGFDDETRETLVGEISEIRERLSNLESSANGYNEINTAAFDTINAQLADIQAKLETPAVNDDVYAVLAELNDKVNAITENGVAVSADSVAANSETLQAIVDELAVIKEKIDVDGEYDTIGEILSLREDVKAARIVDQNEVSSELEAIKNELALISSETILDEVRAMHDELSAITGGAGAASATEGELNLVLNEIVSLRDEVFAFKDDVLGGSTVERGDGERPVAPVGEDSTVLLDELSALRANQAAIADNIEELKSIIGSGVTTDLAGEDVTQSAAGELNAILAEIINLKNDIDRVEQAIPTAGIDGIAQQVEDLRNLVEGLHVESPADALGSETDALTTQLDNIFEAINELRLGQESANVEGAPVEVPNVADEIAGLRAEIAELRAENEQLRAENAEVVNAGLAELREAIHDLALSVTPTTTEAGDASYAVLIDEIRSLKEQIASTEAPAPSVTLDESTIKSVVADVLAAQSETDMPLSAELSDIRDEIAQLRSLTTVTAEAGNSAEIAAMRNEIYELRQMLAMPEGMSVIAEDVSAIKSDVQILKEEPDLGVLNEILALREEFQSLREEIEDVKAVASKNDRQNDETILNEVQSLRDQLFAISMANVNDSMSGESNYESYNNIILDEIASLREQIETAGSADDIRTLSDELAKMKSALDSREELYETLSGKVDKLANSAADNKILHELSSLRTELSNQRDADLTTLNYMAEMAKILERKSETAEASAESNETIANEVAKLREEIAALTDREKRRSETVASDESVLELEESLSDLKDQLSEIAGIVEPVKKAAKKPASKSTSKAKPKSKTAAKKPTTRKKSPAKRTVKANEPEEITVPAEEPVQPEPVPYEDDFEAKLAEELAKLGGDNEMSLDPNAAVSSDVMDIADKLAKQVANKLIMEQLVEQLGDGGVSDERVDEILRDILPQEFTTVALTSQSDKVRQLANQLVINKLKARLRGIDPDEE